MFGEVEVTACASMGSREVESFGSLGWTLWLPPQSISRFFGETAPDRGNGFDDPGPTLDPSRFRTAHAGSSTEGQP
jgi:hypothetical protein